VFYVLRNVIPRVLVSTHHTLHITERQNIENQTRLLHSIILHLWLSHTAG